MGKFAAAGMGIIIFFVAALALAVEPIKIAAIFAESGIAVTNNTPHIQAVKLAVKEVNRKGGVLGRPLELFILDNRSTPIGSSVAAQQAVELDVTAVIGAAFSSHSLRIAPVLQQAGIPMITGSSTNPQVTRIGDFIFRTCFIDSFQARAIAQFAYFDLNARTAAVLEIINEEFSLTLAELFVNSFSNNGGQVILKASYANDAVDFAGLLELIKPMQPDVVYLPGYARDSGLIIKQARNMGIATTFLGADGWGGSIIYEYGGETIAGNYYSAHWHHDVRGPQSDRFQKMYESKYAVKIPHMNSPLTYDATLLLADAIGRAGSLDRPAIREAIASTQGFQGATGTITFDDNGDPLNKPVVIMKLEPEAPIFFKTIQP